MSSNTSDPNPNQVPGHLPPSLGSQLPSVGHAAGLPATPYSQGAGPWAGPAADEGINIVDYLHSLRRRWLVGLVVGVLLAGLTAGVLWMIVPVTYEAASLLHVKRNPGAALRANDRQYRYDDREYQSFKLTQVAMIESWHVLGPAILTPGISTLPMFEGEEDKVNYLASILQVDYPDDAEMLRISLRGEDPADCQAVVRAVTRSYLDNVVYAANQEEFARLEFLRSQLRTYETNMQTLRVAIHEAELNANVSDSIQASERRASIRAEIDLLNHAKSDLALQISNRAAEYDTWNRRLNLPYDPSEIEIELTMRSNPRYQMAVENVQSAQDQLDSVLARTTAQRFVQQAQTALNDAEQDRQRVYESLEEETIEQIRLALGYNPTQVQAKLMEISGELDLLAAREEALQASIEEKMADLQAMHGFSETVDAMRAQLARLEETAETVSRERDILDMNTKQGERIVLLQDARTEERSDIAFKYIVIFGAALIVLVLSIVGVTLGDYLGKRVNSTNDVVQNIHLPVVGTLPIVHGGWMSQLFPFGKDSLGIKLQESIDSIRTTIIYNRRPTPVQVVMVSSAGSQEGKTTVASQLAVSLARAGRRTLLIDGDFHNPQQHEVFGMLNNTGFSDVLRGEVEPAAAPLATEAEGLWLMTTGYCDRRALQALASPVGRKVIEDLRTKFDYIVLDSAPVLTGAEALLLGQHADCAVLSIRRDISRITKVSAACQRLESVGIDLLGGILNGAPGEIRRYATQGLEEYEEEYEEEEEVVVAEKT